MLAVSFSFLAVFAAILKTVFLSGLFALDVLKAENFLSVLEKKSGSLLVFGDGSSFEMEENFFTEWTVFSEGNSVGIEVKSTLLGKTKTLKAVLSMPVILERIEKNKRLRIKVFREDGFFLVKNSEPDF